ncbi:MAG: methionyl-tRNA formyltransferase [Actinomycetota bacterium]
MARIVFAGSPEVSVPYLRTLAAVHEIVLVISRIDSPVGRKRVMSPTPVAQVAEELGLPLLKTNSLRGLELPDSDIGVVVAYGGLVPDALLDVPVHGWINAHFSLLPALRGAAPVQRGLWNGDTSTGISIFQLVSELDAGPLYHQREVFFEPTETASQALSRIASLTVHDIVDTVDGILAGELEAYEQTGLTTFAPKFTRDDGHINWLLPAHIVENRIRALTDEPGAYTLLGDQRIGIQQARLSYGESGPAGSVSVANGHVYIGTGDGTIELMSVKPAGKNAMSAIDWARGLRGESVLE